MRGRSPHVDLALLLVCGVTLMSSYFLPLDHIGQSLSFLSKIIAQQPE